MVDEAIVLAVPAALAVSCAGPGLLLLRRARLRPDETVIAGIVLSLLLLHLASFAVFALEIGRAAHYAILVICLSLTVARSASSALAGKRSVSSNAGLPRLMV